MSFHEVQFPEGVGKGSRGGPGFGTKITEVDSGATQRYQRKSTARHFYDARYGINTFADLSEVLTFYMARNGGAYGFRFKDWTDYASTADHTTFTTAVAATDQLIGAGDGVTTQFQLRKSYTSGVGSYVRRIQKPVSGTVVCAINGTPTGAFTVNTATGVVTFTTAPTAGQSVTAGFRFDVPVIFGQSIDDLFSVVADGFNAASLPSIPLVELIDEREEAADFFYGHSKSHGGVGSTLNLAISDGRVHLINATSSGLQVRLPAVGTIATGGPYFFIVNQSGTNAISLRDSGGTVICTIAALQAVTVVLTLNGAGVRTWFAY
jgi:uncharacterized protein (TIGR02217 family)